MSEKVKKTEAEWRNSLTVKEYSVLREKGTERPFSGKYVDEKRDGVSQCAACGHELFSSDTKYTSGSGWPSFWDVIDKGHVKLIDDDSLGMSRVEVVCANCDSHLGHVFEDGPQDKTGLRYCINSVALDLKTDEDLQQ